MSETGGQTPQRHIPVLCEILAERISLGRDAVVVDGELLVKVRVLATIDEEESNSKAKETTAILVAGFLDKARA